MSRTALLLMDFQQAIVARVPGTVVSRAADARAAAREAGVPVFHIGLQLRPGHVDVHPRNKLFGSLPADVYTPDDPGTAFAAELTPADGDTVVHKNRVSAFAGNDLRQLLAARDITRLVLAGIATSGIVLSTALQAVDLDYAVTVLSDACADADPALHTTLLDSVLARRGEVTTVDAWRAALARTAHTG
ncbi:isochorismatase family protein [Streptomyces sp. SID5785]|uniref:cysteine hydrolase family protein n=1 Tax=Streptomyces sp. SID5785 TaxID=2690309 RepID=UPI00136184AE|nr:cysteine hydrolase [Streptomyces sp. SID5785]MZD06116.1 isochorismatase family protein [Streptomyces sp. SID5785]